MSADPSVHKRIGVTGLKGFLGGEVATELRQAGHLVCDLDPWCRHRDAESLRDLPAQLDWVLHFAARTSIEQSRLDPKGFLRDNLAATQNAAHVAVERGAALLYLSSYVYGQPQYNPVDELHPTSELNPYMASKLAGEKWLQNALPDLPVVVLRPFSVYGRQRQPGRLVSDLLECVRAGRPLAIADATPRRDHLYSRDFCALAQAIVTTAPVATGVYNVGSGVANSNLEVAELLAELAGETRPVAVLSQPRPNDVPLCIADLRKVHAAFGWSPHWSLRAGLAELVAALGPNR